MGAVLRVTTDGLSCLVALLVEAPHVLASAPTCAATGLLVFRSEFRYEDRVCGTREGFEWCTPGVEISKFLRTLFREPRQLEEIGTVSTRDGVPSTWWNLPEIGGTRRQL